MDTLTPEERSRRMSLIRSTDTKAELVVRGLTHRMGYRYRLHDRKLPGTPDLVFRKRRKLIFVHGCFWHGHDCKLGDRIPKTRVKFWTEKICANRTRDKIVSKQIKKIDWKALVIWECQLKDQRRLAKRIRRFLDA